MAPSYRGAYKPEDALIASVKEGAALQSTYERGIRIVRNHDVISCSSALEGASIKLTGKVAGSYGSYVVGATIDFEQSAVTHHSCTCPAHAKYDGMCKHVVALALNALAWVDMGPINKNDATPLSHSSAKTGASSATPRQPKPAKRPAPLPPTSATITDYLSAHAQRLADDTSRLALNAPEAEQVADLPPVELECLIQSAGAAWRYTWADDTWSLGLRITRGKASYVVKDIHELVSAWQTGAVVTYGKNLAFAHHQSAFSERANRLLEHISGVVESQRSLYMAQEHRSYSYRSYEYQNRMSAKALPLSTKQLLDVLRIMLGAKVVLETSQYVPRRGEVKSKRTLDVVEGNPELRASLTPTHDNQLWELRLEPSGMTCIGDERELALGYDKKLYLCSPTFTHDLGLLLASLLPMDGPAYIRQKDMPGFCAATLPALRRHANLAAPDEVANLMPPEPELTFRIALAQGCIVCTPSVGYDNVTIPLFAEVYDKGPVRNVQKETAAQQLVRALFPNGYHRTPNYGAPHKGKQPGGLGLRTPNYYQPNPSWQDTSDPWFDKDDDEAYYLLFSEGLTLLSQLGEVYLDERLSHVGVRQAPSVTVEASVAGGLLDLAVTSEDMDAHELMAYLASYRSHRRYVRLDNGDIVRLDGSIQAVADLADGLGVSEQELVEGMDGLPTNRTLFVDAMLKRADGVQFSRNAGFRQIVRDFETIADADFTVPTSVQAKLRPYQQEGFRWLCTLGKTGFGGILADDMGLGKTLQAIAYLAHARAEGEARPSLVVCPASLVYNWQAEFERFCPSLEVAVVAGTKRARSAAIAAAPDYAVLITSYDLMKRDTNAYVEQDFHCVILDEAQYIKNANTQVARAAKQLPAHVHLALTGTPIENRLSELWSIFDFLMPGVLGKRDSFTKRFSTPIGNGDEASALRLQRLVGPFILRRLKRDVLRDLPDKNESVVTTSLEGEQAKLYRASAQRLRMQVEHQLPEEFAGMRLQILAELTKLRQICCDPHIAFENYQGESAKLDTCMELVSGALDGGHRMLIFSQFTSMLDRISDRLDAMGIEHLILTGTTSKEARARLVERFQAGEAPVFLISLKAGGVGLNLTAADIVVHFDPWWNVAAEDQATDRAHRIGQTRDVSVFKLVAKDTIEEKIIEMQQAKRALADAVISGEAMASASITRDDILALLEG